MFANGDTIKGLSGKLSGDLTSCPTYRADVVTRSQGGNQIVESWSGSGAVLSNAPPGRLDQVVSNGTQGLVMTVECSDGAGHIISPPVPHVSFTVTVQWQHVPPSTVIS
jgi:hypothetical protein